MNKSFSSCLPFSSPSLDGVWLIHHNSSEIVAKRVAFSFEGLEETFGECFFSRSKKQAVFSAHDICLEAVRERASPKSPSKRPPWFDRLQYFSMYKLQGQHGLRLQLQVLRVEKSSFLQILWGEQQVNLLQGIVVLQKTFTLVEARD